MNYRKNIRFSNTSRIFNDGLEFSFEGNNPFSFPFIEKDWDPKVILRGDKAVDRYLCQKEELTEAPLLKLEISKIGKATQAKLLEALKTPRFQNLQSLSLSKVNLSAEIFDRLQEVLKTRPDLKILEISNN